MKAALSYLAENTQATRISLLCGGKVWSTHFAPGSLVDLYRMFDGDVVDRVVYAFTRIHSPTQQDGELWAGATKGLQVYLNGEQVISETSTGGWKWKGIAQPITLNAGDNRILVKVNNTSGYLKFSLAVVDNGLNAERISHVPHASKTSLGAPIDFTGSVKRKYFGGDTLPGTCYHLAKQPATGVDKGPQAPVLVRFVLAQNYPNPVNAQTTIRSELCPRQGTPSRWSVTCWAARYAYCMTVPHPQASASFTGMVQTMRPARSGRACAPTC